MTYFVSYLTGPHEMLDLAPLRKAKSAERNDVHARLEANRFRPLTLG